MKQNKIAYTGVVTITIEGKPKTITTNSGTSVLFKSLCDILTTIYLKNNVVSILPAYMSIVPNLLHSSADNSLITNYADYSDNALVTSLLPLTSRSSGNNGSCKFATLFPYSSSSTPKETLSNCYVLLLNGSKQIMAFTSISYDSIDDVFDSPTTSAVIEWEMMFENKSITESTSI